MFVLLLTVKEEALTPLNVTAVVPRKFNPLIVTPVPPPPDVGVKLVILAGNEKLPAVTTVLLLVVRLIVPVVEAGTVTLTDPKDGVEKVALTPLNLIEERPSFRFAPLIVTVVPAGPKRGEKPEMLA